MSNNMVQQYEGELRVSSLDVAFHTGTQHKNVLELVGTHLDSLEEYGTVAFETRPFETAGGTQVSRIAHLSEPQSTLLITFMRNSPVVVEFKKTLVREFYRMRQANMPTQVELTTLQIIDLARESELGRIAAEQRVSELAPKADAWQDLASGTGTYAVGDAAKMLQQAGIKTGRDRLFDYLLEIGWLFRKSGRLQAMQTAVDAGRLVHKPQSHRHPETGETVLDSPQVRVTVKGIEQLRALMLPPVSELVLAS